VSALWIALALIALQRVWTLAYAKRNTGRLLEEGAVEAGAIQFPLIALLQAAWLASMAIFIPASTPPIWWLLGVCAAIEIAHIWIILTLGKYWTTRVITVPGAPLVRSGAYGIFRHPNYIAVLAQIALLPLAFHAYIIAIVFAVLYAALITWRIRVEDALLAPDRTVSL
jgi:methyltransferase